MCGAVVDYEKLLESLESQELEAHNGIPSNIVYEKLLAVYFMQNDILSAKMLWHRIPAAVKEKHTQLEKLWTVGKHIFLRERAMVFHSIDSQQWSVEVSPIIQDFKVSYREHLIELIAKAYTSIGLEDVSKLLGLTETEAMDRIEKLGWKIDKINLMVSPCPPKIETTKFLSSEQQLNRLTKYVSFLETGL